jgi:type I restriction enzyme, S subunit
MSTLNEYMFSDLYTMSSGISSKPEQAGHGSPFASFSIIFNNYFLPQELPDLMNTSDKEQETYSIKKGDVFLTRTSETLDELGMSCVAIKDYPRATFSGFVKRLRPKKTGIIDDRFIGFYLRSKFFRKAMTNNAIMTLRASLNEEIFSYLKLYLPEYHLQKKIGHFLFQLNAKIELNNRINAELEAMAKTIYDYWFVQFDFPDQNGKPYKSSGGKMVWNEELKRAVPEGWEVKTLGNLGDFKNGVNYDPSNPGKLPCPIINVRNISGSSYFLKNEDLDIIYLDKSDVEKYSVHNGSIIIARSGIPGATRLVSDFEPNTLYCGFAIHFNVFEKSHRIPVFFFLKSIEQQIQNGSGGTIMKNVSQGTLSSLKLPLPGKNDLTIKLNELIDPVFGKIIQIQKENQQLASLRDWLLPMLMNGQVKVKDGYEQAGEGLPMATEEGAPYSSQKKKR